MPFNMRSWDELATKIVKAERTLRRLSLLHVIVNKDRQQGGITTISAMRKRRCNTLDGCYDSNWTLIFYDIQSFSNDHFLYDSSVKWTIVSEQCWIQIMNDALKAENHLQSCDRRAITAAHWWMNGQVYALKNWWIADCRSAGLLISSALPQSRNFCVFSVVLRRMKCHTTNSGGWKQVHIICTK